MIRAVFLLALIALGVDAKASEVYKCVTENGVVRYSATPCRDGDVEKLDIESDPTDIESVRENAAKRQQKIAAIEAAEIEAEKQAAESAKRAAAREKACVAARERLQRLRVARRVTTGEGESKRYLESEEIMQRRQDAQDKVDKLCGE